MKTTENAAGRYADIDNWSTRELVDGMVESQFTAIAAVSGARADLAKAIDAIAERLGRTGRLIYLGAGTSGRIGAQDGAELPPTFNWPYERAITLMAGGPGALQRAVENAEDSTTAAAEGLDALGLAPSDVVIGLAASGSTPYVVAGLEHARKKGALTIAIINNPGGDVELFRQAAQEVLDEGKHLIINGFCASACVILADLARSNTCITAAAQMAVHKASIIQVTGKAFVGDQEVPVGRLLRREDPPESDDINRWVYAHGGYPTKGVKIIPVKDARQFWPSQFVHTIVTITVAASSQLTRNSRMRFR